MKVVSCCTFLSLSVPVRQARRRAIRDHEQGFYSAKRLYTVVLRDQHHPSCSLRVARQERNPACAATTSAAAMCPLRSHRCYWNNTYQPERPHLHLQIHLCEHAYSKCLICLSLQTSYILDFNSLHSGCQHLTQWLEGYVSPPARPELHASTFPSLVLCISAIPAPCSQPHGIQSSDLYRGSSFIIVGVGCPIYYCGARSKH